MKVNVSEIVNRVDLKSAIEQYTGGRFNRNGFISCPFHVDREPSLSVKRERFHCFSCDRGGDVIDFTQTYFNLDFRAASKKLSIDFNLGLNIECREKEKTEEPDFWTKVISEHDEKRKRHIQEIIAKKKEERESIEKKI